MNIVLKHPLIEEILTAWKLPIGHAYEGYRGHVYRMFNCCLALRPCSPEEVDKLAIAAAFHDLGIWSDHTLDYLPPSVKQAQLWLKATGREAWIEEISQMIDLHHKIRPVHSSNSALIELFRKADLVDFSLGVVKFGLPASFIKELKRQIPNAGFHRFLISGATDWFRQHPLSPPPFMKW